jgi:uncharacterized protein (DUF302 family)
MLKTRYTLSGISPFAFDTTVEHVRQELRAHGFGVLCEIDVRAILLDKLGIETEPYLILGACNPQFAHQALEVEPDLGVLLPCNVVVYEHEGLVRVSAVDPEQLIGLVGNEELEPIAADVQARLTDVVESATAR